MEIVGADPPSVDQIRDRHERLSGRLRDTASANGHDPDRLRIVAITKTHSIELVRSGVAAGLTLLGESRVQEAEPKVLALADVEWHLVGRLQSNKARRAVNAFSAIHAVDSVRLLRRLAELARDGGHQVRLLIQVNISGEAAKGGMSPTDVLDRETVAAVRETTPVGLMTIAPMGAGEEGARRIFARLRTLRDRLQETSGVGLPELSMGMSADAEAAAAEGATLVRIGTALFGPRP